MSNKSIILIFFCVSATWGQKKSCHKDTKVLSYTKMKKFLRGSSWKFLRGSSCKDFCYTKFSKKARSYTKL